MNNITEKIKINRELIQKIEKIACTIEIDSNNYRIMLFSGFLQEAISHFYAINYLIEIKLYNSAFALIRIFFDTLIRGQYIVYIIDNNTLNEMYLDSKDWKLPKINDMCLQLDTLFRENIFNEIRLSSYGAMCDYTHIGQMQIARHFNELTALIKPNFEESLILDTLEGSYTLMELFAKNYIAFMKASKLLDSEVIL